MYQKLSGHKEPQIRIFYLPRADTGAPMLWKIRESARNHAEKAETLGEMASAASERGAAVDESTELLRYNLCRGRKGGTTR